MSTDQKVSVEFGIERSGVEGGNTPRLLGKRSRWSLLMTLPVIAEKRIKVVINGGGLNPKGLAQVIDAEARAKGHDVKVAWVEGDDLLPRAMELLHPEQGLQHLDGANPQVHVHKTLYVFQIASCRLTSCADFHFWTTPRTSLLSLPTAT